TLSLHDALPISSGVSPISYFPQESSCISSAGKVQLLLWYIQYTISSFTSILNIVVVYSSEERVSESLFLKKSNFLGSFNLSNPFFNSHLYGSHLFNSVFIRCNVNSLLIIIYNKTRLRSIRSEERRVGKECR